MEEYRDGRDSLKDIRGITVLHHLTEDLDRALLIDAVPFLDRRDERLLHSGSDPSSTADVDLERQLSAFNTRILRKVEPSPCRSA